MYYLFEKLAVFSTAGVDLNMERHEIQIQKTETAESSESFILVLILLSVNWRK